MAKKPGLAFITAIVTLLAVAGCGPFADSDRHSQASSRPNFVFALTDDLAPNLVPYMPHVLALDNAGLTMSHYYVVDSLCCPSRTAILTGDYPHDDGALRRRLAGILQGTRWPLGPSPVGPGNSRGDRE